MQKSIKRVALITGANQAGIAQEDIDRFSLQIPLYRPNVLGPGHVQAMNADRTTLLC